MSLSLLIKDRYALSNHFLFGISVMMGQVFQSGENRTNVIELFTSEGCSSCPPAETWMNNMKDKEGLFETFIPIVFHVSYWNNLGWKDTFAKKAYDDRQRWYSSKWGSSTIYTPGLITNGKEYRGWFDTRDFPKFKKEKAGALHVNLEKESMVIEWRNKSSRTPLHVNVAVLGFDYSINVLNGENAGRTLEHDFTVLGWDQHSFDSSKANLSLPKFEQDDHKKALVVWLSDSNGVVIQATGGYLK